MARAFSGSPRCGHFARVSDGCGCRTGNEPALDASELEQENVRWNRTSSDETTWAGTALGTVEHGDETFCARVSRGAVEKPRGG